jgi:hypothetical protein
MRPAAMSKNVRTALVLGGVALVFFLALVFRRWPW